jgi:hypothetical protein
MSGWRGRERRRRAQREQRGAPAALAEQRAADGAPACHAKAQPSQQRRPAAHHARGRTALGVPLPALCACARGAAPRIASPARSAAQGGSTSPAAGRQQQRSARSEEARGGAGAHRAGTGRPRAQGTAPLCRAAPRDTASSRAQRECAPSQRRAARGKGRPSAARRGARSSNHRKRTHAERPPRRALALTPRRSARFPAAGICKLQQQQPHLLRRRCEALRARFLSTSRSVGPLRAPARRARVMVCSCSGAGARTLVQCRSPATPQLRCRRGMAAADGQLGASLAAPALAPPS